VLVAIIALVIWVASGDDAKKSRDLGAANAPAAQPDPAPAPASKPVFKITASKLFTDYDRNEVAADEAMKGKVIRVSGRIQSIDKDFMDDVIVNLATPNEFMPARMEMVKAEKSAAAGLNKGQAVEIECERMTRLVGSPSGRKCSFVQ
jgi:hypothetical protein